MTAITIETLFLLSTSSGSQSYRAQRGRTTYYMTESLRTGLVYVSQCYVSRLGRRGERCLPAGKLRDELLAALAAHKAAPLRERLCTQMTVGQASIALSTVL